MTWVTEEEGKLFTIATRSSLEKSRVESKGQSLVSVTSNTASDIPISGFNKMNSFAYDSSQSFIFECFVSYNANENITPK